uniref:Ketoreductase (KR) domain-containing protein n=1 Tax=Bionectria ochroleuca TaxID=29856 RepID=A0A0B7KQR5_BIOOC
MEASKRIYHILLGCRSLEKGEKALDELLAGNPLGTINLIQLDVTSAASIQSAVQYITENHGRLDVLVSNAGITSTAKPIINQLHETFDTNTFGPAVLTEAMTHLRQKSRESRMIFVSSELGSFGRRTDRKYMYDAIDAMAYHMSKAALNMLAMCFAKSSESWETPAKTWCYDPGFCVIDLMGPQDRKNREKLGARSSEPGAQGLIPIIEGQRDLDAGKLVDDSSTLLW